MPAKRNRGGSKKGDHSGHADDDDHTQQRRQSTDNDNPDNINAAPVSSFAAAFAADAAAETAKQQEEPHPPKPISSFAAAFAADMAAEQQQQQSPKPVVSSFAAAFAADAAAEQAKPPISSFAAAFAADMAAESQPKPSAPVMSSFAAAFAADLAAAEAEEKLKQQKHVDPKKNNDEGSSSKAVAVVFTSFEPEPHCDKPQSLGAVIGIARGCPAYSNGGSSIAVALRPDAAAPGGAVTGRQWDAVEYARRWLLMAKDVALPQVPNAADIWSPQVVSHMFFSHNRNALVGTQRFANGATTEEPTTGDLVVWDVSAAHPLGHVAVVAQAAHKGGVVQIAEQGVDCWSNANYSRSLRLEKDEVSASITLSEQQEGGADTSAVILGWLRVQAPFLSAAAFESADRFRHVVGKGRMQRVPFPKDAKMPWLDNSVAWDNFQRQSFGKQPCDEQLPSGYYVADYDLWQRSRQLAESCHRLLCDVSRRLIQASAPSSSPAPLDAAAAFGLPAGTTSTAELLERDFNVPRALHGALRDSLRMPACSGRFDVGFDGSDLKIFEYNCDSSAALLETAETQQKIAQHYKFDTPATQSAGATMWPKMVAFWREFARSPLRPPGGTVHFCVDDDPEERFTALCMMQAAKDARLNARMQVGMEFLKKSPDGTILDVENKPIECIWKTWNWDTALRDFANKEKQEQDAAAAAAACVGGAAQPTTTSTKVRLCELLFHPKIIVMEPFWKLIAGSKALLAYAYRVEPQNEFLLRTFFHCDKSIEHAYVKKPTSGRAGANITVFDDRQLEHREEQPNEHEHVSGGRFADSLFVFQEKLSVKKFQGLYPILCPWVIGSQFGGMVVRESDKVVTALESPVAPLRIMRF